MQSIFFRCHQSTSASRSQNRLHPVLFVAFFFWGWSPIAWSQVDPHAGGEKGESGADFRFTVQMTSETGAGVFVPEKWGTLPVSMTNRRSEEREVLCTTYLGQDSTLQYGRRVWIPGQAVLRIDHPIFIPKLERSQEPYLDFHSLVFEGLPGAEVLVRSNGDELRQDGKLIVTHQGRNTAILGARSRIPANVNYEVPRSYADSGIGDDSEDDLMNLVATCRVERQMKNTVSRLGDEFLPSEETRLDLFDHIVVADRRIADDFAAAAALRRWLHAGGHMWVMLDRVDPVVLEVLLGDEFQGHIVDRVGLTSVQVDEAPAMSGVEGKQGVAVEYDVPVEMVQMMVSNMNVTHVVNGWPAAMTSSCGEGKLLVTTLGARGWLRARPAGAEIPKDPLMRSEYRLTEPMTNISDTFFRLRNPEFLRAAAIEPQVQEYIGYKILSWWLIVGTLLAYSIALVAAGIAFFRYGRFGLNCWVGTILSLAVSLFLIQAGRINRQGIPATQASIDFVQAIRGTDDLRAEGVLSVYHPEESQFPIAATQGGDITPEMSGREQTSRRRVTTDLGKSHWENLHQIPGLRSAPFKHSAVAAVRLEARVSFDAQGLTGQYAGFIPPGTDALIATQNGRIGVTLQSDGGFVGQGVNVFEKDQYLSAGLLSDEQDRRRRTMKELINNPRRPDFPELPQLLFWSDPQDHGFHFGEGLKNQGASLIAVPLTIERPASGTEILIPSPLLNYISRRSPTGVEPSAMWNFDKKQWQDRSAPGLTWLSFQIPRELLPVIPKQARIHIKVSGPIGRVEILGLKKGDEVLLHSIQNPVGSVSIDLNDADALTVDDDGRLILGLSAGNGANSQPLPDLGGEVSSQVFPSAMPTPQQGTPAPQQGTPTPQQGTKVSYWRIESLALELRAITSEPTSRE